MYGVWIHFVMVRSVVKTIGNWDYWNKIYTLYTCNLPALNSLESIIMCKEKIVKYGALREIFLREGETKFPLIEQHIYPSAN